MIDQSRVQSGFDAEVLLGSRYLKYFLLNAVETGAFPLRIDIEEPPAQITIHPPQDYQRLYAINPEADDLPDPVDEGAFETEILFDHATEADLRLRAIVDILLIESGRSITQQYVDLYVQLALETEETDAGVVRNAQLRLEVVDLAVDPVLEFALALVGVTLDDLLPTIKQYVDRNMDMGIVGASQNLQAVAMKKLPAGDSHPAALGIYLNLRLRNGPAPNEFHGARGKLDDARNFLPADEDMAFGMPASLYEMLSDDALFRLAEEKENASGDYHYPIRKNQSDPNSDRVGKIKNITVRSKSGNRLFIDVHGEYFVDLFEKWDIIPDPDFHFTFTLTPKLTNGLLDWDVADDLDLDLFGELLVAFVISAVLFGLGTTGLLALIVFAAQELIAEPLAKAKIGDRGKEAFDANFLDALPHRLTVERRRWDPFYVTLHQVVGLIDDLLQINEEGIGFSGTAVLDKEPETVNHAVIRTEERDPEEQISALWYRVIGFDPAAADSTAQMPATDRRSYTQVEGDAETNLYRLSLAETRSRLGEQRVRERIPYFPKRVYIREGQIRLLLCISDTELNEVTNRIIWDFRNATRQQLVDDQSDQLREEVIAQLEQALGQTPTEEQIEAALNARIDGLVAEQEAVFREEQLAEEVETALDETLRFDLDSPEFYALEDDGVLTIVGYERMRMERNGRVSFYYRDHPDGIRSDNLLELPRYRP